MNRIWRAALLLTHVPVHLKTITRLRPETRRTGRVWAGLWVWCCVCGWRGPAAAGRPPPPCPRPRCCSPPPPAELDHLWGLNTAPGLSPPPCVFELLRNEPNISESYSGLLNVLQVFILEELLHLQMEKRWRGWCRRKQDGEAAEDYPGEGLNSEASIRDASTSRCWAWISVVFRERLCHTFKNVLKMKQIQTIKH